MSGQLPDLILDRVFRDARTFGGFVERPVPKQVLHDLHDLLKWGPTSTNQQPLRIVWCHSAEARARLAALCYPGNAEKVVAAPVAAVLGMDLDFVRLLPRLYPHADAAAWYGDDEQLIAASAFRNSSLQAAYLIIAARLLGLDTNPMSGLDADKVNATFFPDGKVRVNFITTLGYGDPKSLHPRSPRLAFDEANVII